MSTEIARIKTFFTGIQVHLSDMWLESCVNWCKAETLPPNYTPKELQSKVYEQWLLLDLRDVELSVLPLNLSTKQLYTLNGNFCLQMMQIVDISKPKLWQLQKVRNSNALTRGTQQDADVVGTGKRLLQMTLTDGVQEVEAMEYQLIPCLSLNLAPGVKIRILGPVTVRRGRLMLQQQNVKILGGEVEDLLVSNAAENVLARGLKLPENPNPGAIQERLLAVEREETSEGYMTDFKVPKPSIKPAPPPKPTLDLNEQEELLISQEIDMIMEVEAELNDARNRSNGNRTPDLFDEADFDNLGTSVTSTQVYPKSKQNKEQEKMSVSLDDDFDDIFENIDIESGHITDEIIPISKLLHWKSSGKTGIFKIKARFKSVEEKLTVIDGQYKLVIKIEDSSDELVVRVHSDVTSDFADCSAATIINLRSNVLGKDEAAVERMMKAIMRVKDRLLVLDNVVEVQIEANQVPVIVKVL